MVTAGTRDAALGYQWLQILIPQLQLQTTELTLAPQDLVPCSVMPSSQYATRPRD